MKLAFDTQTGSISGMVHDQSLTFAPHIVVVDAPADYDESKINDYTYVVDEEGKGSLVIDPQAALSTAKTRKLRAIRTHFDAIMQGIKATVAAYEIQTWDTQREELVRFLTDPSLPTPYVDSLAAARGETRDTLFPKIQAKVQQLAAIQGAQQALEKRAEAVTSIEELESITW